jgi:hypothetical protein
MAPGYELIETGTSERRRFFDATPSKANRLAQAEKAKASLWSLSIILLITSTVPGVTDVP